MKTPLWVDGDLAINRNKGKPVFISGTAKTAQDMAWNLMTESDELRSEGCGLKNSDLRFKNNGLNGGALKGFVGNEVRVAVERLRAAQMLDIAYVTDAERITGINQLIIAQDQVTNVIFHLSLQVASEDVVPLGYKVRLGQQFVGAVKSGIPGLVTDDNR